MSKTVGLLFPNQLFKENPILDFTEEVYIIEEHLFFRQYNFHQQKIAFHRATMKFYAAHLEELSVKVNYINSNQKEADIRNFQNEIDKKGISEIVVIDPTDNFLQKRIEHLKCEIKYCENPSFINSKEENLKFFSNEKKTFLQAVFYKQQRKRLNILIDKNGNPEGGNWSFDKENRKKYPKAKSAPALHFPNTTAYWKEAVQYTQHHFSKNYGKVSESPTYPINYQQSEDWLQQFFDYRFSEFGAYEDAIVAQESFLNHSVLTPMLNVGLLTPKDIIHKALDFARNEAIPINSTEGFVRQIIGWREFIRGIYEAKGSYSRTKNYWNFNRKIPSSFYDGTTGILPIDNTIKKILETGYCHHIERLMVLGNFMLLCEFDPDEVYKWFMELFIDAYDWVMVPNVYGMTQFADGGLFATKPYIGGSNYIKKMSNYPKGDWEQVWDGLFWNFIDKHQDFFKKNQRSAMMVNLLNKMPNEKRTTHLENAHKFLHGLD